VQIVEDLSLLYSFLSFRTRVRLKHYISKMANGILISFLPMRRTPMRKKTGRQKGTTSRGS